MLSRRTRTIALATAAALGLLTFAAGSVGAASAATVVPHVTNASSTGPVVVGIGDSILMGHGLDPDQAWLSILATREGWRLTNLASDGSGFITQGDNGDTFADQAKAAVSLHPDIIIVSGSSNDLGDSASAIAAATTATIAKLHAELPATRIIAVSGVWGDTSLPTQMNAINADVIAATAAVGGTYLNIGQPLSDRADLMQGDDVHPTAQGQMKLAHAVLASLTRHNLEV